MKPSRLALRDSIRVFELGGEVVVVAVGKKPARCQGPELAKACREYFELACKCEANCDQPATENYFVIQPIRAADRAKEIKVRHARGVDTLPVRKLDPNEAGVPEEKPILGISQDFSLEVAFKDALSKIAPNPGKEPRMVEVVALGALYGGFSGFSRLFVGVSNVPEIAQELRRKQRQDLT